jgi:hypothetical protein
MRLIGIVPAQGYIQLSSQKSVEPMVFENTRSTSVLDATILDKRTVAEQFIYGIFFSSGFILTKAAVISYVVGNNQHVFFHFS